MQGSERNFNVGWAWLRAVCLVALGVTGVLAVSSSDSTPAAHPLTELRTELGGVREAIRLYRDDHGRAPCQAGDDNVACDPQEFVRQLTGVTNQTGRPGEMRDAEYRFGPYLSAWPVQPLTRSAALRMRTALPRFARCSPRGGWIYDPRDGGIEPDLPDEWVTESDEP